LARDFVSVPVQDMERAKRFYSETLGIHSPTKQPAAGRRRLSPPPNL